MREWERATILRGVSATRNNLFDAAAVVASFVRRLNIVEMRMQNGSCPFAATTSTLCACDAVSIKENGGGLDPPPGRTGNSVVAAC
ncbi:MAG: hypothetical protein UY34_C0019G0047 [Parcubacteria group bacterium GW2011_GWA2_48_9]|nr:MAG: hypothetical protein UY34_C0019G0047 [Parcubacteria group bacterium GW2011_GWA2_48_9]